MHLRTEGSVSWCFLFLVLQQGRGERELTVHTRWPDESELSDRLKMEAIREREARMENMFTMTRVSCREQKLRYRDLFCLMKWFARECASTPNDAPSLYINPTQPTNLVGKRHSVSQNVFGDAVRPAFAVVETTTEPQRVKKKNVQMEEKPNPATVLCGWVSPSSHPKTAVLLASA